MLILYILIFVLLVIVAILSYFLYKKQKESDIDDQLIKSSNTTDSIFISYNGVNNNAIKNLRNIRNVIINNMGPHVKTNCDKFKLAIPMIKQAITSYATQSSQFSNFICNTNNLTELLWNQLKSSFGYKNCVTDSQQITKCTREFTPQQQIIKNQLVTDINSLMVQLTQKLCPRNIFSDIEAIKMVDNISKLICDDTLLQNVTRNFTDTLLGASWKLVDI